MSEYNIYIYSTTREEASFPVSLPCYYTIVFKSLRIKEIMHTHCIALTERAKTPCEFYIAQISCAKKVNIAI